MLPEFQVAGAMLLAWGAHAHEHGIDVAASLADPALEYAAIRKHAALLDMPQRGVLELTGNDRLEFLNRMVTQELKGVGAYALRRSFWLSRTGRIEADLRVVALPDRVLIECDALSAAKILATLGGYIITEACELRDATQRWHRLGLHGPKAAVLLAEVFEPESGAVKPDALPELGVTRGDIDACAVVVARDDTLGVPGYELMVPAERARAVYGGLVAHGHQPHEDDPHKRTARDGNSLASRVQLQPCGWFAANTARIEAGTPLELVDFGPESLPAETGVLHERVSFTKGCYLGQEIVARMHNLGKPKQVLVAIKFAGSEFLPERGEAVYAEQTPVGAITSATLSPMLGMTPIAFAQVRTLHAAPGTRLLIGADRVQGVVQERLRFLPD